MHAEGSGGPYVRFDACISCFIFISLALLAIVIPYTAHALAFVPYVPSFRAEHDGISIFNGNPSNPFVAPAVTNIDGSTLGSIDQSWTIEQLFVPRQHTDAPNEIYVLERVDPTTLQLAGAPQVGVNYVVAPVSFNYAATSTLQVTFSIPSLGDSATPSGTYVLMQVSLPLTKSTYDPTTDSNITTPFTDDDLGDFLTGDYDFTAPIYQSAKAVFTYTAGSVKISCTQNCNSNVLFLPGIESSNLYAPGTVSENQIWLPDSFHGIDDIPNLDMSNQSTANGVYTKEKDVLDAAYKIFINYKIYASFIDQMNELKQDGAINDWEPVAYDWRLDYQELLSLGNETDDGKIYYRGANAATSTPYIAMQLRRLAASSKTGKVTIIAHSNGGLLAKAIMENPDLVQYVDKIVLVATPQLGTPKAIGGLLSGYDQALPSELFPLALSDADARYLAQNTPVAYNLLPSDRYFSITHDPVITFDPSTLSNWNLKYTSGILSNGITTRAQMRTFMTDQSRTKPAYSDTATPEIVNSTLFDNSSAVHAVLDTWTPPQGVQVITIAGWGDDTLSGIQYKTVPRLLCGTTTSTGQCAQPIFASSTITYDPQMVINGDGTVIDSSAQWTDGAPSTQYWLNLLQLNATSTNEYVHANIFEVPQLRSLLAGLITNSTSTLPQYISTTEPVYSGTDSRLYFILHSPLTLGFTDVHGNYSGSTATTSVLNVPGVEYERFGEVQWLSVPKGLSGKVVMQGTGSGSFTLDIEDTNGAAVLATTTFAAVPSATSTMATFVVNPNQSSTASGTLSVDFNGDGTIDSTLHAKQNAIVLPDIVAPTTTISLAGAKGENGWFTSNVIVTLNATDTGSGIKSTFFSLDGAATSTGATTSITTEGIHSLRFYSIDNAGNQETPTTTIIKIDKTSPEAVISASTSTKDLLVNGLDNLSTTTVTKNTATTTIIVDQAGNTTTLNFQKTFSGALLTYAKLSSMQYGTSTPISLPSSFTYLWNPLTNPPVLLSQTVIADSQFIVEGAYDKTKDKTTIIVLKKNTPIQTVQVSGLDIIKLTTSRGVINYSW